MGIVLIKDQGNQRFYVHEILSIEEGATPFKTGTVNNNGDTGGDAPSVMSILQKIASVNTSNKKTLTDAEYMSAVKRGDLHS